MRAAPCSEKRLDRSRAHKASVRPAPEHHTPRYILCGPQTAARSTNGCCIINLRHVITVTLPSPCAPCSEKRLDRSRAHKASVRPAPEHHTPRYILCGPQTAARSTNGCCNQPTLRHHRYTRIPVWCVRAVCVFGEAVGSISRAQSGACADGRDNICM